MNFKYFQKCPTNEELQTLRNRIVSRVAMAIEWASAATDRTNDPKVKCTFCNKQSSEGTFFVKCRDDCKLVKMSFEEPGREWNDNWCDCKCKELTVCPTCRDSFRKEISDAEKLQRAEIAYRRLISHRIPGDATVKTDDDSMTLFRFCDGCTKVYVECVRFRVYFIRTSCDFCWDCLTQIKEEAKHDFKETRSFPEPKHEIERRKKEVIKGCFDDDLK